MSDEHKPSEKEIVSQMRFEAGPRTDAEVRLMIKTLREILLARQQARAAKKYGRPLE